MAIVVRSNYDKSQNLMEDPFNFQFQRVPKTFIVMCTLFYITCTLSILDVYGQPNPIQQLIDNAEPGATIFVDPGTYVGDITIYKAITLISASKREASIEGNVMVFISVKDSTFPQGVLQDFIVRGYIEIKNSPGFVVSGNEIKLPASFHRPVIHILSDSVSVSGNLVSGFNNDYGIYVWGTYNLINYNTVEYCTDGIRITNGTSFAPNLIKRNNILNSTVGITVENSSGDQILKNRIHDCKANGIRIQGTAVNLTIKYNIIEDNKRYGIIITPWYNSYAETLIIAHNSINYNGFNGIFARNCKKLIIENNFIMENGKVGIELNNSMESKSYIVNNFISWNNSWGISVNKASKVEISKNQIALNGDVDGGGIVLIKVENSQVGPSNNINDNQEEGIKLIEAKSNEIINNKIAHNKGSGIRLLNSESNIVRKNKVESHEDSKWGVGILLESALQNIIRCNEVKYNEFGVLLRFDSDKNRIDSNFIFKNESNGILIGKGKENEILNNDVEDNGLNVKMGVNTRHNTILMNAFLHKIPRQQAKDEEGEAGTNEWSTRAYCYGNYWSDHIAPDKVDCTGAPLSDGIRDAPRKFIGGSDRFPLVNKPANRCTN